MHNFDNRARLGELAARPSPPQVTIFHGADDSFIPPKNGVKSLAHVNVIRRMIDFHEVPGATHNTIVDEAGPQVRELMSQ